MYRIALVNMPFASASLPSIALTQLKAVTERELGDAVDVRLHYLNLDFASAFGLDLYAAIAESVDAVTSGLGDWFFRPVAFPGEPDNADVYLTRHFADRRREMEQLQGPLFAARQRAGAVLDELIERHDLASFDLVGMTSMFSQNVACFALARRLKELRPDIVTVMGGANCETPMGQVIVRNAPMIDFVASGPALVNFPRLVRHLTAGEHQACHELRGLFSRERLARATGELREAGEELDIDVPVPLDFDGFLDTLERTFPNGGVSASLPFETSRGCWWGERSHCTFCGLNGVTMKYRSMSPDNALALLNGLFERYGDRVKRYQSVDNILPREYLTDLLPRLRTPERAEIFYEVKADLKVREMAVLAEARVTQIQPGIEALATSTLKLMGKGTTSFQNLRFLKSCLRFGIEPHWNLLVGFPGEEEEVYKKYFADLPLLVHLPPPSGAYPVRFDRYSPYFTRAAQYDLKLKAADFYQLIYPFPAAELEQLAYFFADANYQAPYLMRTAKWIGKLRQRIDYWHSRWHQRDRGLKPSLEFQERRGTRVVVDTRAGMAVEHDLGPLALQVLEVLMRPMKLARLTAQLTDVSEADAGRLVTALKGRGLVFQDRDLFLSLVVDPEGDEESDWIAGRDTARPAEQGAGVPAS